MTASFQFCHRWRKQSIGIIRVPVFIGQNRVLKSTRSQRHRFV
jgi:hypothetical protein